MLSKALRKCSLSSALTHFLSLSLSLLFRSPQTTQIVDGAAAPESLCGSQLGFSFNAFSKVKPSKLKTLRLY